MDWNEYVPEQLRKQKEAEWESQERRGDFIEEDNTNRKTAISVLLSLLNPVRKFRESDECKQKGDGNPAAKPQQANRTLI
ncbi:hypothetical protein [Paenibacillus sp. L3-i20]|uniref:hypothetical protein n=1 Tax=Paenibacillus sp. L3-i20 TaxID=2905833 RepID=UPI001EDE8508|nr:hypothetical protein [Paenibacillus sp. L3-i20]GKU78808.1 hypothetical protein L3i20_v232050 [Paenibacillus sp. L3-i20]